MHGHFPHRNGRRSSARPYGRCMRCSSLPPHRPQPGRTGWLSCLCFVDGRTQTAGGAATTANSSASARSARCTSTSLQAGSRCPPCAGADSVTPSFRGADTQVLPPTFEPRNPYKGLRAFQPENAYDFFGREHLVDTLVDALQEHLVRTECQAAARFLAVIGPSGSGKSSVVLAGLLPLGVRTANAPG